MCITTNPCVYILEHRCEKPMPTSTDFQASQITIQYEPALQIDILHCSYNVIASDFRVQYMVYELWPGYCLVRSKPHTHQLYWNAMLPYHRATATIYSVLLVQQHMPPPCTQTTSTQGTAISQTRITTDTTRHCPQATGKLVQSVEHLQCTLLTETLDADCALFRVTMLTSSGLL